MPHKKAKRTIRERVRHETGADLDPGKDSIRDEPISKSAARVFNAQVIRDQWREKKRKLDEDESDHGRKRKKPGKTGKLGEPIHGPKSAKKKISLTIQPGESMQHFNRRVEDDLRPLVKSAAQSARVLARNVAREEQEARRAPKHWKGGEKFPLAPENTPKIRDPSPPPPGDNCTDRVKEFQTTSTSAPKRLNDIAQAPPEFKKTASRYIVRHWKTG
jgi:hypothetical protein